MNNRYKIDIIFKFIFNDLPMLKCPPGSTEALIDLTQHLLGFRPTTSQMQKFFTYHLRSICWADRMHAEHSKKEELKSIPEELRAEAARILALGQKAFANV